MLLRLILAKGSPTCCPARTACLARSRHPHPMAWSQASSSRSRDLRQARPAKGRRSGVSGVSVALGSPSEESPPPVSPESPTVGSADSLEPSSELSSPVAEPLVSEESAVASWVAPPPEPPAKPPPSGSVPELLREHLTSRPLRADHLAERLERRRYDRTAEGFDRPGRQAT